MTRQETVWNKPSFQHITNNKETTTYIVGQGRCGSRDDNNIACTHWRMGLGNVKAQAGLVTGEVWVFGDTLNIHKNIFKIRFNLISTQHKNEFISSKPGK